MSAKILYINEANTENAFFITTEITSIYYNLQQLGILKDIDSHVFPAGKYVGLLARHENKELRMIFFDFYNFAHLLMPIVSSQYNQEILTKITSIAEGINNKYEQVKNDVRLAPMRNLGNNN
jgi:hypothetical protein